MAPATQDPYMIGKRPKEGKVFFSSRKKLSTGPRYSYYHEIYYFPALDVWQKVDFLWQPAMTSSSGWTKKKLRNTSESQTWAKRRSWSLFGDHQNGHCHSDPLYLSESLWTHYIWEVFSESMRHTRNYTGSWHWSTEKAWFFSTTMSNYMLYNLQCFKSWMNRPAKFCLICCIHLTFCQPTTTSSSNLRTFCR